MLYFILLKFFLGVAQILVEDSGQNSIVIVAGANNHLTPEDVKASRDTLAKAKIMLTVLEVPRQTVLTGLKLANELGGIYISNEMKEKCRLLIHFFVAVFTVLNAAPAVADLEDDFYALSDIFCVNETEVILD